MPGRTVGTVLARGCTGASGHAALQGTPELHVRRRGQFPDPSAFLRPWSGSSDSLCLLFLPPPTPVLQFFCFPLSALSKFSDFRWKREKMACDLAGFNRRANKEGR